MWTLWTPGKTISICGYSEPSWDDSLDMPTATPSELSMRCSKGVDIVGPQWDRFLSLGTMNPHGMIIWCGFNEPLTRRSTSSQALVGWVRYAWWRRYSSLQEYLRSSIQVDRTIYPSNSPILLERVEEQSGIGDCVDASLRPRGTISFY